MIVAVAIVGMMQMAVYQVIRVIAVRNPLVTALGTMNMIGLMSGAIVLGRAAIRIIAAGRDLVIVGVVGVRVVHVAIVKIVSVSVVTHRRMPAIRTVRVSMSFVLCASCSS